MKNDGLIKEMGANKLMTRYWLIDHGFTTETINECVEEGVLKLVKLNGPFSQYENQLIG